jgi:adenosylcobyric acid synthase
MAKTIMIQGTMSSVGKSFLTTGLCRVFRQDGFSVAPFKAQNMSGNSFVTTKGLEMSRAQVIQAEAAGVEPDAMMNPVLLKPVSDTGSEVIVNGENRGPMRAVEYFQYKKELIPVVKQAFETLAAKHEIIVIEGAGSPAEINLKQDDIVNMGLAKMLNAPVVLVGDVDCGGVFAQIVGTLTLLEEDERARVKASIVNKFRGDVEIFRPGISMLEEKSGKPCAGVLPYLQADIEEEDSLVKAGDLARVRSRELEDAAYRQTQYDILAAAIRKHLYLPFIYDILEGRV